MADERHIISRREFTALSIAAGVAAATGASGAAPQEMMDTDVQVKTAAGVCDAALNDNIKAPTPRTAANRGNG